MGFNPVKAVTKAVKKVTNSIGKELNRNWNKWGQDVFATVATGGLNLAADYMADKLVPDIPEPKTESPGSGVMVDQTSVASDALLAARKRAATRISLSSTNHTGQSLMRTGSLKSTLG